MADKILMLALSPTMETGQIVKWHKKEGDKIESGDVICEVETDKAVMEYEASIEGTLLKILVPEGAGAAVGEPIGIVGEEGEDIGDLMGGIEVKSKPEKTKKEPDLKIEKSTREQETWKKPEGRLEKLSEPAPIPAEKKEEPAHFEAGSERIRISPLARKIAGMYEIDLSLVKGTGPDGRIIKRDVEKMISKEEEIYSEPNKSMEPEVEKEIPVKKVKAFQEIKSFKTDKVPSLESQTIPVTGKRKMIAKILSDSKYSAPHYYLTLSVRMDEILESRKRFNAGRKDRISLNAVILKLIAEEIKNHPIINSSWTGDAIEIHGNIDIGLAVAVPDGLIVPVVKNCGNKGIVAIDREIKSLVDKAKSTGLNPDEYKGATFTVSNLGSYGIEEFTAIINPPGVAILAVGEIRKEPVVVGDNTIKIQSRMRMTLSCDHRVIDGATGALFLKELKDIMEDPLRVVM